MLRATVIALAFSCLALPAPAFAKGGPRTLSDYNIQKEYFAAPGSPGSLSGSGRNSSISIPA